MPTTTTPDETMTTTHERWSHWLNDTYTEAERAEMARLSGGRAPVVKSHKHYTTFNPLDEDVAGCGHIHHTFEHAARCVDRLRQNYGEHRLVVGHKMYRDKMLGKFPAGRNIAARNGSVAVDPPETDDVPGSEQFEEYPDDVTPDDVTAQAAAAQEENPTGEMPKDENRHGEPIWLDRKVKFGKYREKRTWRELSQSSEGRSYLRWCVAKAMNRTNPKFMSPGEYAKPVLDWRAKQKKREESISGGGSGAQGQKPSQQGENDPGSSQDQKPSNDGTMTDEQVDRATQQISERVSSKVLDGVEEVAKEAGKKAGRTAGRTEAREFVKGEEAQELIRQAVIDLAPKPIHVTTDTNLEGVVVTGQHPKFETLLRLIAGGCTRVWVAGPAGGGKTTAARKVAEVLEREFFLLPPVADKFEAFGFIDAGGTYQETEVYRWATAKPGAVLLIDELDGSMPQALVALNSLTDKAGVAIFPNGEKVAIPDEHVIVATANTYGVGATADYVGRAPIDGATRNRFPAVLDWEYDEDFEEALCLGVGGEHEWVVACQKVRANLVENRIKVIWSPRDTMDHCRMRRAGFTPAEAFRLGVLASAKPDQVRKALDGVLPPGEVDETFKLD